MAVAGEPLLRAVVEHDHQAFHADAGSDDDFDFARPERCVGLRTALSAQTRGFHGDHGKPRRPRQVT